MIQMMNVGKSEIGMEYNTPPSLNQIGRSSRHQQRDDAGDSIPAHEPAHRFGFEENV